jgi:hypothetical protein
MRQVVWAAAEHLLSPLSSPFFRVKWLYDYGFRVGLTQKIPQVFSKIKRSNSHSSVHVVYSMRSSLFLQKIRETLVQNSAKLGRVKKSAKSLFFTCCHGGLVFKTPRRIRNAAHIFFSDRTRSGLECSNSCSLSGPKNCNFWEAISKC